MNARLSRFMAQDWLESSGAVQSSHHENHVVRELAIVQKWLSSIAPLDATDNKHSTWSSACLVPILKWEETSQQKQQTTHQEIESLTAPEFRSVPNDAIWSLAIHPGGVEAWLKSLVSIGYVPV